MDMEHQKIIDFWTQQKIATAAELDTALDAYCIDFAYHSGKIENCNITYYDTREIFTRDGVTSYTGDLRTLYEIRNEKDAYTIMLSAFEQRRPLTETLIKEFQKALTKNTYDTHRYQQGERPGEYKQHDYIVGPDDVGAPVEDVAEEMAELLDDLQSVPDENALIAAAYFHAKFENIHPFSDGNGRTGRLAMNYFLLLHNHPPIIIHEEDRKEYYDALNSWDKQQDLQPLINYLMSQLEKTWQRSIAPPSRAAARQTTLQDITGSAAVKAAARNEAASEGQSKDHDRDRNR